MKDFHGLIFAYSASPELRELVSDRTAASLPFCGRYRLIDFSLANLQNAGIVNVGVIMQRDYQSLLDHIGNGQSWDMSRKVGGLRILPPFGLPEYHKGNYSGTMEALNAVSSYIRDINEKHIIILLSSLCANIDLSAACEAHLKSGAGITALCADGIPAEVHHRYVVGKNGFVKSILFDRTTDEEGLASLEGYIIEKSVLLDLMNRCRERELLRFHRDGITMYLNGGGKMNVYRHTGYARIIRTVDSYYRTNMDMLNADCRHDLFAPDRPVNTRHLEGVSTYYGENASSINSLVADNCIILGNIENCIIFSGVRIGKGAKIRNSIIMRGSVVGEWSEISNVIADKRVSFAPGTTLMGSPKLPMIIPKNTEI